MPHHRQRRPALTVRAGTPAVLATTLFTAGCAGPIADLSAEIPKKAAPAAIQGATSALADPALRKQIAAILASPEMRDIQRELVAGITDSALDTALDPASQRKLQKSVGAVVGTSVRAVTDNLHDTGIAASMSSAMTEQLGPAMESTMRDDVGPGLAAVLANEDLQRSLGATARLLGREIVLGTTDALSEQKPPPEANSPLARLTNVARQGAALFGSAAWVLILVIALLFAWIVKLLAQARRYRSEANRKVATAQLLEEAARAAEGKPWAGELIGALQERVRAEERALAELRETRRRDRRPPRERHA